MGLKFAGIAKRRRTSNLTVQRRKIVVQDVAAIDQFGDVPTRKRAASAEARKHGHDLRGWVKRSNDPAGRWNAFCVTCNKAVVVCTETPEGFTDIYGPAYTEECPV
jgi:hypothetical protein